MNILGRGGWGLVAWVLSASVAAAELRPPVDYGTDSKRARKALDLLSTHTLERSKRAPRLFVEGYFMRSLVAAHDVTTGSDFDRANFDTRRGLEMAIAFADSMVLMQNRFGYWELGYPAQWWADMGAALGIFPMLEPHVDEARLQRYQEAAERFLAGLRRDRMLHDDGGVGLGRPMVSVRGRRVRAVTAPYLVSTALCGIEVRAWLYRRTGEVAYRDAALASLEYTLSQIDAKGRFIEETSRQEGLLRVAAYVQEGWMAADQLLEDSGALARLRAALPAHVGWILREQRADGTWDDGLEGSAARTPPIVNFLIWYDQRCEKRDDVRGAIRRAARTWQATERWEAMGLFRDDEHHEVQRALLGRPLAALAAGRYVF